MGGRAASLIQSEVFPLGKFRYTVAPREGRAREDLVTQPFLSLGEREHVEQFYSICSCLLIELQCAICRLIIQSGQTEEY